MRIVLDTNVLVSALLTEGICSRVLELVTEQRVQAVVDGRIMNEYFRVLSRGKFDFPTSLVEEVLEDLESAAEYVDSQPCAAKLPDETDQPFLECAVAGHADCIVTGNKRHFPLEACLGIPVLSPAEFIAKHGELA